MLPRRTLLAAVWLLALAPAALAQAVPPPETIRVPVSVGGVGDVVALLYKPAGPGPFPLVLYSHGRSGDRSERLGLKHPVRAAHASYWVRKGVAVLAPVRPGYGDTGGSDREDSGAKWRDGQCYSSPDFASTALRAREAVQAVFQWAVKQPWVRPDRVLLVGQSVGGMTTVAASELNWSGALGTVNFAGGAGGNPTGSPGHSCAPGNLTDAYRAWGQRARAPSLWLYAPNDDYWGPDVPKAWHKAYAEGGSDTTFVATGPVDGHDGHQLVNYGMAMWSKPLDAFVDKVGLLKP